MKILRVRIRNWIMIEKWIKITKNEVCRVCTDARGTWHLYHKQHVFTTITPRYLSAPFIYSRTRSLAPHFTMDYMDEFLQSAIVVLRVLIVSVISIVKACLPVGYLPRKDVKGIQLSASLSFWKILWLQNFFLMLLYRLFQTHGSLM